MQLKRRTSVMNNFGFNFDNSYLKLPDKFYSRLGPVKVTAPEMIILNHDLAAQIGLDFSNLDLSQQAALFTGNVLPDDAEPFAQAYAGHQFGHFTILGDGRAIVWGEHIAPDKKRMDVQFKGSGLTPYSRRADGRAALGPMLREYIISEAMYALGIPTTRSLAVAKTGEDVIRQTSLPGAILTRVAASHIRVGTFEFAAVQRDKSIVEKLLDYSVERHYPEIKGADNTALEFLNEVIESQSDLIVHWMRAGFIHGVMNTDNMALSGETIDYGPCAFMDAYNPQTVFSSIDQMGRYAYTNQPVMAQWNIARLAETLLPLIDEDINKAVDKAEETVNSFSTVYKSKWLSMMRSKLGLFGVEDNDERLISNLLGWMHNNSADFTNTFRVLSLEEYPTGELYQDKKFKAWHHQWQMRLKRNTKPLKSSLYLMKNTNPAVIPRNHMVEQALEAATIGNMTPFHTLLAALKEPYKETDALRPYQSPPPHNERVYQTFCGT